MTSRESAALDRYITGDCWPWKRNDHVIAHCKKGHKWPAIAHHECGCVDIVPENCPKCGELAEDETEPDDER